MTIEDLKIIAKVIRPESLAAALQLKSTQALNVKLKTGKSVKTEQIESLKKFLEQYNLQLKSPH